MSDVTLKRIIDLETQSEVDSSVYTIIDSPTGMGKKYPLGNLVGEVDNLKQDFNDIEDTVKATTIYDTATGAVASFADGADGVAVKSLVVGIEPVQNLHGMDSPYPAGATNNLIPDGTDTSNGYVAGKYLTSDGSTETFEGTYISEYFPVTSGETYTYSNNLLTSSPASVCFYDSEKTFISGSALTDGLITLTAPSGAVYARASQYYKDFYGKVITQFELGSTATAVKYYSNICPIVGWTGSTVRRDGINIAKTSSETLKSFSGSGTLSDGVITGTTGVCNTGLLIEVKPNTKYTLGLTRLTGGTSYVRFAGYMQIPTSYTSYRTHEYINSKMESNGRRYLTITTDEKTRYLYVGMYKSSSSAQFSITDIFVNVGDSSVYTPYVGEVYPITFPTEAGTVYGGTLDVVSGVLTVTKANIASYDGETLPGEWISDRDVYEAGTTPTTGAQVVYDLATPQTCNLTPTEVKTLLGQNNIWADTGDSAVTYPADPKLYVDSKVSATQNLMELIITANRETGTTASKAYSEGDLVIINGTLYKVASSIANGGTFTIGTNVTATTIAAQLAALA